MVFERSDKDMFYKIDKNKISKLLGIFLIIVAIKFFYEYIKL